MDTETFKSNREAIIHTIDRFTGMPRRCNGIGDDGIPGELENRIITYLASVSSFTTVQPDDATGYQRFQEFTLGKVHIDMGLQSICQPYLVKEYDPLYQRSMERKSADLARMITNFVLNNHGTQKNRYYGVLRLLASSVQNKYFDFLDDSIAKNNVIEIGPFKGLTETLPSNPIAVNDPLSDIPF